MLHLLLLFSLTLSLSRSLSFFLVSRARGLRFLRRFFAPCFCGPGRPSNTAREAICGETVFSITDPFDFDRLLFFPLSSFLSFSIVFLSNYSGTPVLSRLAANDSLRDHFPRGSRVPSSFASVCLRREVLYAGTRRFVVFGDEFMFRSMWKGAGEPRSTLKNDRCKLKLNEYDSSADKEPFGVKKSIVLPLFFVTDKKSSITLCNKYYCRKYFTVVNLGH